MAQKVVNGEIVDDVEDVADDHGVVDDHVEPEIPGDTEGGVDDEEKQLWDDIVKEETGEGVPVSTHIRVKSKLKGRLQEKDDELAALRKEIEEMKNWRQQPKMVLKRPDRDDFDTDEEYEVAVDQYDQSRFDRIEQERQRKAAQADAQRKVSQSVDDHYARAEKFVTDYGIAPERYQQADLKLKSAVDKILPGAGETVVNQFISVLGKGSERVLFRVGAKEEELAKLQSLLIDDNSGIKAAIYLGEQKALLTNPKKRVSSAPNPSPQLKGDVAGRESFDKQLRKYKEAHKKGNLQEAYNLKKAAKMAGADTSTW